MKKIILPALIVCAIGATSFKLAIDKTSASVQEMDGLQVFVYSKPTSKFDVSGSVKGPMIPKDNIEKRIRVLVERAKEKFPSAEGIIINNLLENAEVIRFKE